MKAFRIASGMIAGLLAGSLAACGQPTVSTVEDDRRMDQALTKMKLEQKRTDEVEAEKQRAALERMGQRPTLEPGIPDAPVLPIQPPMIQDQNAAKAAPLTPLR